MDLIESLNENAGAAMASLTAVYAVGTFIIVWFTYRAVAEQRRTREAMDRPRLVAFLENDSERGAAILVLRNTGRGVAENVSVDVRPPLNNPLHPDLSIDDSKNLLRLGTPTMVPGYEIRSLVGTYGNWDAAPDPTPVVYLCYRDSATMKNHSEAFPIDMSMLFDMPASRPKTVHSVAEELKTLNRTLLHISRGLEGRESGDPQT